MRFQGSIISTIQAVKKSELWHPSLFSCRGNLLNSKADARNKDEESSEIISQINLAKAV